MDPTYLVSWAEVFICRRARKIFNVTGKNVFIRCQQEDCQELVDCLTLKSLEHHFNPILHDFLSQYPSRFKLKLKNVDDSGFKVFSLPPEIGRLLDENGDDFTENFECFWHWTRVLYNVKCGTFHTVHPYASNVTSERQNEILKSNLRLMAIDESKTFPRAWINSLNKRIKKETKFNNEFYCQICSKNITIYDDSSLLQHVEICDKRDKDLSRYRQVYIWLQCFLNRREDVKHLCRICKKFYLKSKFREHLQRDHENWSIYDYFDKFEEPIRLITRVMPDVFAWRFAILDSESRGPIVEMREARRKMADALQHFELEATTMAEKTPRKVIKEDIKVKKKHFKVS